MQPERSYWGRESPKTFFHNDDSIRTYNSRSVEEGQAPWIYYTGEYVQEIGKLKVYREKYEKKKREIKEIATKLARRILWERWKNFPEKRQKESFYDPPAYIYRVICPWCDIEDPWWDRCDSCEFRDCLDPLQKLRNFWTANP